MKAPSPAPALYVPSDASADSVALADGLCAVFGFERVTNVAPTLLSGRRLLLLEWRDYYDEAIGRYPPKSCWLLWPHGWATVERRQQGARLRHALSHLFAGEIGMFWSEIGDEPPQGAMRFPPVWGAAFDESPQRSSTDRIILSSEASLTAVAGILAANAVPCIPQTVLTPPARDIAAVTRADAIRAILAGRNHVLYRDAPPAADLYVCLDSCEAWPHATIEAVRAGVPVIASESVTWVNALPEDVVDTCLVPAKSSLMLACAVTRLLDDDGLRDTVIAAQRATLERLRERHTAWAAKELRAAGFVLAARSAPTASTARARLALYADTPGWAQHHFVMSLAREAAQWGIDATVATGASFELQKDATLYSPTALMADGIVEQANGKSIHALSGLWSHVSYGGWFTDDALDPTRMPKVPAHATNLYLHALTGLPYLAAGIDTDLFAPPSGRDSRRARHQRDAIWRRLVIGFTASLQYNAAVKLFHDLWVPAVRLAGSDGHIAEARICARPLPVWDVRDARDPKRIAEYLKGVDIYLCTSISEGSSLSVLEAASAGCAIISTPCGNAPELASEIVGWDAAEIARVIQKYERDRELLYEAQEHARQTVLRFWSWASPIKRESWRAWLAGGDIPSWREQVPYCTRGGWSPQDYLARSRAFREFANPPLIRQNMMGS